MFSGKGQFQALKIIYFHKPWAGITSLQQGSKLLGFRISETPKNGEGNPNLGPGFPTGNPQKMAWT